MLLCATNSRRAFPCATVLCGFLGLHQQTNNANPSIAHPAPHFTPQLSIKASTCISYVRTWKKEATAWPTKTRLWHCMLATPIRPKGRYQKVVSKYCTFHKRLYLPMPTRRLPSFLPCSFLPSFLAESEVLYSRKIILRHSSIHSLFAT